MSDARLQADIEAIFREVRAYLLGDGRTDLEAQGKNPKGDTTLAMDKRAEEIAVEGCRRALGSFQLFSEERGVATIGKRPQQSVIIDPVDGSTNFSRGVRATGFSLAVIDGDELDLGRIRVAVTGDVFHGDVYTAIRGGGAFKNGDPVHGSQRKTYRGTLICLNASVAQHAVLGQRNQMSGISGLRWCGAAVLDISYVADGGYDAFMDLRGGLTPENFAAPSLIISEAGGVVTDRQGRPFGQVDLARGKTVVAAGNPTLHAYIIDRLNAGVPLSPKYPWILRSAAGRFVRRLMKHRA